MDRNIKIIALGGLDEFGKACYVIEIEEKSGIPTIVEQLNESHFTADVSLKRYFIVPSTDF